MTVSSHSAAFSKNQWPDEFRSRTFGPVSSLLSKAGTAAAMALATVAASTAVTAGTATKYDAQKTLAANSLIAGSVIKIRYQGIATSTTGSETLAIKVFVGATEVQANTAVDVSNNDIFAGQVTVTIRTAGASGTCVAAGWGSIGATATATCKVTYKGSQAINTTVANAVAVEVTHSSTGESSRLDLLTVEVSQPGDYGQLSDGSYPIEMYDRDVEIEKITVRATAAASAGTFQFLVAPSGTALASGTAISAAENGSQLTANTAFDVPLAQTGNPHLSVTSGSVLVLKTASGMTGLDGLLITVRTKTRAHRSDDAGHRHYVTTEQPKG